MLPSLFETGHAAQGSFGLEGLWVGASPPGPVPRPPLRSTTLAEGLRPGWRGAKFEEVAQAVGWREAGETLGFPTTFLAPTEGEARAGRRKRAPTYE
jgi:hypothetical protein